MQLYTAPIPRIALENPVNIISGGHYIKEHFPDLAERYRLPIPATQIIQPWYFGDQAQKTTCLWLKNLPPLFHAAAPDLFNKKVTHVGKGEMIKCIRKKTGRIEYRAKHNQGLSPSPDRGKIRSKTFPGIARAIAEQWT